MSWKLCTILLLPILASCGDPSMAGADYTLCDCVNQPPNSDAKLQACSELMEAMDPADLTSQALACRAELPVPEGGPDVCYCLQASSSDPEVHATCQALVDEVDPSELRSLVRHCAAELVRKQ